MSKSSSDKITRVHPYAWLWEPLEEQTTFVVRPMFGTKVVYLHGKSVLCFAASKEPWQGVLICTDRAHHAALQAEFPCLVPHAVLGKWLYLPEAADEFERVGEQLVRLVKNQDPRIGVESSPKKRTRRKSKVALKTSTRGRRSTPPRSSLQR